MMMMWHDAEGVKRSREGRKRGKFREKTRRKRQGGESCKSQT